MGVSQGAAFGAALAIVFFGGSALVTQTSASLFALAGLGVSYLLAHRLRYGGWVLRLVLAGIAVSALFSAGLGLLKYLADPLTQLPEITFWLLGGLASLTWGKLFSYRGTYAKNGKTRRKQDGELVKGLHTPIIDEELFDKCQKIRAERRRQQNSNQTTRRVYLLSGIITCKECGRRMRAQTAHGVRYYRESARFAGIQCKQHGKSLRADVIETKISKLMESLVLPENWQAALQDILNTKKDEMDPQREKARIKGEMRRMREAFKRGLYESDEHAFWREVEGLQAQLDALEKLTPYEVRQAGMLLANLQPAWRAATMEEKQELCQIILKQVVYDFERGQVVKVTPKPEYEVLFGMATQLAEIG